MLTVYWGWRGNVLYNMNNNNNIRWSVPKKIEKSKKKSDVTLEQMFKDKDSICSKHIFTFWANELFLWVWTSWKH